MTIVVPVYNGALYINHCVEQIKAQTYKNLEVIFVNDGSKDNSEQVCRDAIKDDDRFTLINKENGGTSTTRNKGIDNAHGKYIAFFDCDDEYDPEMIATLVSAMELNNSDMVSCGYFFKVQTENETYLEEKCYPYRVFPDFDSMKAEYVDIWDSDMLYNIWNKLYRMFIKGCNGVTFIDKCLYYYVRERSGSTSERYWDKNFEVRDKEYNELKAHFKEMHVWNEKSREYVSREFIERVAGCIENVFHAEGCLSSVQKKQLVKSMVRHPDVREASRYAQCRSKKMRIIAMPIKMNWSFGSYIIGWMIYKVRKSNPVLFHKLKGKR